MVIAQQMQNSMCRQKTDFSLTTVSIFQSLRKNFIHTYNCDGNPIPTFTGEPERVAIPDDIDAFTKEIWENLNENNKISLYVRYISLEDGTETSRMINKYKKV